MSLINKICSLGEEAEASVCSCDSVESLSALKVFYLGRSGALTAFLRQISTIKDPEERKSVGAAANFVCSKLKLALQETESRLLAQQTCEKLLQDRIDISLPPRPRIYGKLHPISKTLHEVRCILGSLGFNLVHGPEIEDEFHVFDALNTPKHHPAREKNNTFYLSENREGQRAVLRTHTSSVQIRVMENNPIPPIKIMSPGRVYRNDWDATHSPMFHQMEGLFVDRNVNMGHLKYCINYFLGKFFGKCIETRLRASFFPFTEPSAEVDVRSSEHGWMEVMGCGMVHSNVLRNVNIDPGEYSGFAFGMGIERMAMIKYGIADLRDFYNNKLEWLNHYGFCFTSMTG